jgi:hypothetical protein
LQHVFGLDRAEMQASQSQGFLGFEPLLERNATRAGIGTMKPEGEDPMVSCQQQTPIWIQRQAVSLGHAKHTPCVVAMPEEG